jgi:hypothetical protein
MTSKWALTTAVFINYVLGLAIFIAPENNQLTYIGAMPGLLILISLAVLFSDVKLVPERYKKEYHRTFFVLELIMSLLVIEFFIVKVWSRIEEIIFSIIKFLLGRGNLFEEMGGNSFMSLLISGIALCFLLYAISATNSTEAVISWFADIYNTVEACYTKIKQYSSARQSSSVTNACIIQPQACKSEPALVLHCVPTCVPPTQAFNRNPHCPVHGDHEINRQVPSTPTRRSNR